LGKIITREVLMFNKDKSLYQLIFLSLILAACQSTPTPEAVVETVVMTEVVEPTAVEAIQVVTPTPEPAGPRTLVICMGAEPSSLYPFGEEANFAILVNNAFAEGNWGAYDTNSYAFQPIILEKMPNLADGDAAIAVVTVSEGDQVVDASGEVVILDAIADPAIMLIPVGGGVPTRAVISRWSSSRRPSPCYPIYYGRMAPR
jgi:peptide/nickel transport system substrate-binding protein